MILYHFTTAKYLKSILRKGLKPGERVTRTCCVPPGHDVVWLTKSPLPIWACDTSFLDCRIMVEIPTRDIRLVPWRKWARENYLVLLKYLALCACPIDHSATVLSDYCYFGTVPVTMFREAEVTRAASPDATARWRRSRPEAAE